MHRSTSSYGPGTVKEHAARIKGAAATDAEEAAAAAEPLSSLVVLPSSATRVDYVRFKGCKLFRERLVCATLSGRAIRIDDIRAMDERPGIRGQTQRGSTTAQHSV